jgi:hypothetical protein
MYSATVADKTEKVGIIIISLVKQTDKIRSDIPTSTFIIFLAIDQFLGGRDSK